MLIVWCYVLELIMQKTNRKKKRIYKQPNIDVDREEVRGFPIVWLKPWKTGNTKRDKKKNANKI